VRLGQQRRTIFIEPIEETSEPAPDRERWSEPLPLTGSGGADPPPGAPREG
jgi:hypothetical protein